MKDGYWQLDRLYFDFGNKRKTLPLTAADDVFHDCIEPTSAEMMISEAWLSANGHQIMRKHEFDS